METVIGAACLIRTLAVLIVAALAVRVTDTSGDTVEGELQGFDDSAVIVEVNGQRREFVFEQLQSVVPVELAEATAPQMQVTLVSGSRIAAVDVSLVDEQLTIQPRRQKALTVPLQEVKSIRFRLPSPATDPQWLGLLENKDRRDSLAIRREGNKIDPAPVIVVSIGGNATDGKTVGFNIQEESGSAPIDRLEGVIFGGNRLVKDSAEIQVTDVYGSRWLVEAILPGENDQLQLQLSDAITHEVPLKYLKSISWSAGLVMLAAGPPAKSSYQGYLETNLDQSALAKWFGPTADQQTDLLMVGGSAVEYRVDGDFQTLAGSVRRDQSVDKAGAVTVVIALDDQEAWKESLTDSDAKGFELPLNGSRRVRIEVQSGSDGDVGDTVRILRPRLLK